MLEPPRAPERAKPTLCRCILFLGFVLLGIPAICQTVDAPTPQTGTVAGVVTDPDGELIPGAKIVATGTAAADNITAMSDGSGFFSIAGLKPLTPYQIVVGQTGFSDWSSTVTLQPGQYFYLKGVQLEVAAVVTAVSAATSEQIALEEVHAEEKQRVLGIVPNFMVVYDPNPQPLPARLKFSLAFRAATDAVTIAGSAFIAGIDQAADTPAYRQGLKGYGQRFGAQYAGAFSDVMIGGAILPSLLHQDPRYFYQGTGTKRSRLRHAMLAPFLCRGDNGKTEFNYSSIGGDLGGAALANLYYPQTDRGAGMVFSTAAITTAGRIASTIAQEFLLKRLTPSAKNP